MNDHARPLDSIVPQPLINDHDLRKSQERPQDNRVTVTAHESVGVVMLGILSIMLLVALLRAQGRVQALMEKYHAGS